MAKSESTRALDAVQAQLEKLLKPQGFVRRGRTFRRDAGEGVVQVANLQMRAFAADAPRRRVSGGGTGLVDRYTVNLGVFVPELQTETPVDPADVQEYHCALRARIGFLMDPPHDQWWELPGDPAAPGAEMVGAMERHGLPFLHRFGTRDGIVADWIAFSQAHRLLARAVPDVAILLAGRGATREARALLQEQRSRPGNAAVHIAFLDALAARLGLEPLDDGPPLV